MSLEHISSSSVIAAERIPGTPLLKEPTVQPCALVIFGVEAISSKRKLIPALYNLMVDGALPEGLAVVGVTSSKAGPDELREHFPRLDRAV